MDNWFTIEEIDSGTFALSEYGHWEETHCYLLCGAERALLIDTGLGVGDLGEAVCGLTGLPVLVALTHAHWDHIGGLRYFDTFAVHEAERDWLAGQFPLPLAAVKRNLTRKPCMFPEGFCLEDYRLFCGEPQLLLRDGLRLELGGRTVTVLHTPGHSPGHCCFYEAERGTLFTGDLLYKGCLDAWYPSTDPLLFWRSLQRLRPLEPRRLLPGHHERELPVSMLEEAEAAFRSLAEAGKLRHGEGLYDFGEFQIHV